MKRSQVTVARVQAELAKLGAPFELVVAVEEWLGTVAPVDADPRQIQREIIDGAARAAYVLTAMNEAEEHGYHFACGPGAPNCEDQMRATPPRVLAQVRTWAADATRRHGVPLWAYYLGAAHAPGKHVRPPTPFDFGWALMWRAMDYGNRWEEDHPPPLLPIPRLREIYLALSARDYAGLERRR